MICSSCAVVLLDICPSCKTPGLHIYRGHRRVRADCQKCGRSFEHAPCDLELRYKSVPPPVWREPKKQVKGESPNDDGFYQGVVRPRKKPDPPPGAFPQEELKL